MTITNRDVKVRRGDTDTLFVALKNSPNRSSQAQMALNSSSHIPAYLPAVRPYTERLSRRISRTVTGHAGLIGTEFSYRKDEEIYGEDEPAEYERFGLKPERPVLPE